MGAVDVVIAELVGIAIIGLGSVMAFSRRAERLWMRGYKVMDPRQRTFTRLLCGGMIVAAGVFIAVAVPVKAITQ